MVLGNGKNVFSMGISNSPFKCDVPKIIDQGDATVPANQILETAQSFGNNGEICGYRINP